MMERESVHGESVLEAAQRHVPVTRALRRLRQGKDHVSEASQPGLPT